MIVVVVMVVVHVNSESDDLDDHGDGTRMIVIW